MGKHLPPQRRCANRTCRNKIREGEYCQEHDYRAKRNHREKKYDNKRGTKQERGYGTSWDKFRAIILVERGICEECRKKPAIDVHHIIPVRDGGEDTRENVLALCHKCHSTITAHGG